ncbi:tetratricopeptide repeat protein [Thalassolituus sp. LLYu03]|uniref:tetratricopeptide repeat protein n=1 Tax=Thalassolituus sp. LLYu03 TaxID=3421656 RepID=UPI003D2A6BA4
MTLEPQLILTGTAHNFDELLAQSRVPVVVDFWAPWCAPCRALLPVLESVVAEFHGQLLLVKVNADEEPDLCARFAVRSLPSVVLVKDTQIADRFMGAVTESQLRAFLDPYVEHDYDRLLTRAAAEPDSLQALCLLRDAAVMAPGKAHVIARVAHALMDRVQTLSLPSEPVIAPAERPPETAELLAEAGRYLHAAGLEAQREPEVARALARLQLLRQAASGAGDETRLREGVAQGDHQAAIALASLLAARGDSGAGFELLLHWLEPGRSDGTTRDTVRKALVYLINTVDDRDIANLYRRKMFALLH